MAKAWMPLFVGDFLADTSHLTAEQTGQYLLLLMHYWQTGKPLPNDDKQLARIARSTKIRWSVNAITIKHFFTLINDTLHHKRMDLEISKSLKISDIKSCAAKKRWQTGDAKASASAMQKHMPSQSQSHSKDKKKNTMSGKEPDALFEILWITYPKKDGKKEAARHFRASVKTEQDWQDIQTALSNYLKSENVKRGYIKNGSTWFNNWRDWIDPPENNNGKDNGYDWPAYCNPNCGDRKNPDPDKARQAALCRTTCGVRPNKANGTPVSPVAALSGEIRG